MNALSTWDATRKCEATSTFHSTGSTREWSRDQSCTDRADWVPLSQAADRGLQRLRAVQPSSQGHVIDEWKKFADEAWAAPGWREAACEYRDARGGRVLIAEIAPQRSQLLRPLRGDDTTLDRAWGEINARERYNEAPKTTYDAVEFELRSYGASELSKSNCQRHLADLSVAQLKKLMIGLQQCRGQYPAVSDELLAALAAVYDALVISNER